MGLFKKNENEIKVCSNHPENPIPLTWTFAFPGAEYWCSHCGYTSGMLGAGKDIQVTDELKRKEYEIVQSKEHGEIGDFLHAHAVLYCDETKFNGEWIKPHELPKDEKERLRKIRESWVYPIEKEHSLSCSGCIECSNGDENLQEYNDPLK